MTKFNLWKKWQKRSQGLYPNHMHIFRDIAGSKLMMDPINGPMTHFLFKYSKTCVKWPLKNRQTKILMANVSLMKVKSIAECSHWSIMQYFWPALSDNWSWKPISGLLKEAVLNRFYCTCKFHNFNGSFEIMMGPLILNINPRAKLTIYLNI